MSTAAALAVPLLAATFGATHVAFSCDTQEERAGNNVFSAASIGRAGQAGCAVCPNANISSCFTSPSAVWDQLSKLPAGRRAISLEGFSPYYCENPSGAGKTWWWQDKLSDGSASPWGDVWAAEVHRRFSQWFQAYAKLGGQVDFILSDFEMGGKAYWYAFAMQGDRPQDALVKDSRWPALRHRLNLAGAPWNATFDDLGDMQEWSVHDPRANVWDLVVVDTMVAENLNASVYQPIARYFPRVAFSNFAHSHHSDPTGVSGPPPMGDFGWPYSTTGARTPMGTGSHVGTHQSTSIYGKINTTILFGRTTAQRVRTTAASPFDALVWNAAMMRDLRAAAPHVPIQPWIAPKYGTWGDPESVISWLSSSDGVNDRGDMWQENVMHAALSAGASTFLWWKPGANRPYNLGMELMSSVLSELDMAVTTAGNEAPTESNCTYAAPITDDSTALRAADTPYLLSGATVSCGASAAQTQRRIYRLTPRCLDHAYCASRPKDLDRPKSRAILKLYSGFSITPVPDGCWWAPANNASAAGFWIVAPC